MNNKIIKLALVALIALVGFNACNQDNERSFYDENPNVNPPAMTFVQSVMNPELTPDYGGVLKVGVARTDVSETETVALTFTATQEAAALFTLSSTTITFAEGDYLAYAVINFDLDNMSSTDIYRMQLAFANEQEISRSGSGSITISASRKLTFEYAGSGTYSSTAFGGNYLVEFERAVESPTLYKMKDFFVKDIIMQIDPVAGTATIAPQPLGEDIFDAGTESWISCTAGTYANGIIIFGGGTWANVFWTSEGMSSGYRMTGEIFVLPEGAY